MPGDQFLKVQHSIYQQLSGDKGRGSVTACLITGLSKVDTSRLGCSSKVKLLPGTHNAQPQLPKTTKKIRKQTWNLMKENINILLFLWWAGNKIKQNKMAWTVEIGSYCLAHRSQIYFTEILTATIVTIVLVIARTLENSSSPKVPVWAVMPSSSRTIQPLCRPERCSRWRPASGFQQECFTDPTLGQYLKQKTTFSNVKTVMSKGIAQVEKERNGLNVFQEEFSKLLPTFLILMILKTWKST